MKCLILLLIALVTINSNVIVFGMEKDNNITLICNNDEKIVISQKAAQYSNYIKDLLKLQKQWGNNDEQEVSCPGIDNEMLKNVVQLLEKRTSIDVSHITDEKERKKEEQTILHHLVDRVLRNKNYDLDLVKKYLVAADYLGVPFLNNVLTKLFVCAYDKNTVQKVIQEKKLPKYVLKNLMCTFKKHSENNKSIAYYLKKDPEKHSKGFFYLKSIKSLQGIELLPKDTEDLELGGNYITQNSYGLLFPLQPFKRFSLLKKLGLKLNSLRILYVGMFQGLDNLQELNLNFNKIKSIENATFSCMSKLETLNLNSNELQILYAGTFQGLDNLQKLNLGRNDIKSIENGTFSCLKRLKKLNLEMLELLELNAEMFNGSDNLQELNLWGCEVKISNNVFKYLKNLTTVNLGYTNLKEITTDLVGGLSNLENLNLASSYNLKSIDKGALSCMPKLKELDLKSNKLDEQSKKEICDCCKKNNIMVKWE